MPPIAVLLRTGRFAAARGGAPVCALSGVAWASPRFWSRERLDAPESGTFDDAMGSFSTCRKSAASVVSAAKSAWPSAATQTLAQVDRSNVVRLLNSFVNTNPKRKPRMPWVQQFPKLSSVGVLKPCCTTQSARIHRPYRPPAQKIMQSINRSAAAATKLTL